MGDGLQNSPCLTVRDEIDDTSVFDLDNVMLVRSPGDALAEDDTGQSDGSGFRATTFAHNLASKDAVDAQFQDAAAEGVSIKKLGQDVIVRGHLGCFADSDDHRWEVAWNPHWEFDE